VFEIDSIENRTESFRKLLGTLCAAIGGFYEGFLRGATDPNRS
jgi:hypothetical protein